MLNKNYVIPVGTSSKPLQTNNHIPTADELSKMLSEQCINVTMGEKLKGGFVSEVYGALLEGIPVVVKYTSDAIDGDPTVYLLPHEAHYVDTRLLKYLATSDVRVPKVIHDFANVPITVMEDLRDSDFTLLHDLILSGNLPNNVAINFGRDIAMMLQALAKHDEFETALSASQNYYERGLELRLAYPNKPNYFNELETRFTGVNQQLIAVDTHPKNIFVNESGSTAWIDFGFSCWADRDFALPNGLAHIAIYALTGHIGVDGAIDFIKKAVEAYREHLPIDEEVFCKYLATEVLHRWAGKWIEGVESAEQKLRLLNFAMKVFDQEIFTVNSLTDHLGDSLKLPGLYLGS